MRKTLTSTPAPRRRSRDTGLGAWLCLVVLASACRVGTAAPHAGNFSIRSTAVELRSHVFRLNARIDYDLSAAAIEALRAGVPLTIVLETQVKRERPLLDEGISATRSRYLLHKHTLSGRYLVTDLEAGRVRSFENIAELAASLGEIRDLPMVAAALIRAGHRYRLRVRTLLDIEALPSPLRPLAYISPSWWMNSGWHSWPLAQ